MLPYPIELFEEEDLIALRARTGEPIPIRDGSVKLSKRATVILEKMIMEAGDTNRPGSVSLSSALLRSTTLVLTLIPNMKTVGDVAAVTTAALQIASMDPGLGSRLINSIRVPSELSKRDKK